MSSYISGRKTTVKMIQKMAGSLNFICQAIPVGKPFLASLYHLTRTANGSRRKMGHHRRLSKETYEDLKMFEAFLQMELDQPRTGPFLNKVNIFNSEIELYMDLPAVPIWVLDAFFRKNGAKGCGVTLLYLITVTSQTLLF